MQYFGNKLSDNISRREPEGYLLCLNVPVARTGTQDYLPEELGLSDWSSPPGAEGDVKGAIGKPPLVHVFRPEEEVFAPETVASFEGMPVTNDHPAEGVDLENIRRLQMGHAHNVRRGSGEESDLLLADLIITDERLIDAILSGKREISCGYTYELSEENGQFIQRKIRGNHIAVVDAGRAGPRVSIKDEQAIMPAMLQKPATGWPQAKTENSFERRTHPMKKSLTRLLARMAKDGDVETVAEFIEEMIEGEPDTPAEAAAEVAAEVAEAAAPAAEPVVVEAPEAREITIDEDTVAGIIERLDRLITLLTPAAPAADEDPEASEAEEIAELVEEVVEAAVAGEGAAGPAEEAAEGIGEIIESVLTSGPSVTLEDPESDADPDCDDPSPFSEDSIRVVMKAIGPALARLPRKLRRKTASDLAAGIRAARRKYAGNGHASLLAPRAQKDSADVYKALGERIMASRNANYHKK